MKPKKVACELLAAGVAILWLGSIPAALAKTVDYSAFEGDFKGHEKFHYPSLGLQGRGRAELRLTASSRGARLFFNRSLHVGELVFPFSERTRFLPNGRFESAIAVPNFAHFGNASGRARVTQGKIHFTATYHMKGTSMSLVEDATIAAIGRKLTYRVAVEFASLGGLQRVGVFVFAGDRAK